MPTPTKSQKKGGKRIVRKPTRKPTSQLESTIKGYKLCLEDLPDLVLLNLISFLELPDLNRFSQVSKRLYSISFEQWKKIVIKNDKWMEKAIAVTIVEVNKIIYRSCKNLRLKNCQIIGATYLQDQIENLELYQCDFNYGVLERLMSSSKSLKKFSLTNYTKYNLFHRNLHTFYSRNGQTLRTLNLAFTSILDEKHMDIIVKNCTGLKEVDFSNCHLSSESLDSLVEGITKNIEKISLASSSSVRDASIRVLVSECKKIKYLDLSLNSITNHTLINLQKNLKYTLEELDIGECHKITDTKLLQIVSMPKLKVLNCFKLLEHNVYEDLKKNLPQLTYNNPREKWKGWHGRLHIEAL